MLVTLHSLYVCMVAQLHALSSQQNKNLLSVEFSWREHCWWPCVFAHLRAAFLNLFLPLLATPKQSSTPYHWL